MTTSCPPFRFVLGLTLAIATAAAFGADAAKDKGKDTGNQTEKAAPTTKRAGKTHTVTITGNKYSPASLTIRVGDTVVWKNDDDKDHTVNADDRSFKSDNLSPGDDFKHTFAKAGTFKVGCRYHPREKATITVEK